MIACKQCQTVNGLDHKFCKTCGAPLADEAIRAAMEKHEQMVQEGYSLFNAGRTDEAFLIAQAAVEESAESANALTLLGMCFERTGQLAEALECFEKVVSLNPDSSLDRMKVTQLRSSLTNHMQTSSKSNLRIALAAGLAMVTICAVAGLVTVEMANRKAVADNVPVSSAPSSSSVVARPFDSQATANEPKADPPSQNSNLTGTSQIPAQNPVQTDSQGTGFAAGPRETLPRTTDNDPSPLNEPLTLEPLQPKKAILEANVTPGSPGPEAGQPGQAQNSSASQTPATQTGDPSPAPEDGSGAPPAAKADPGIIEISVVPNANQNTSGPSSAASSNDLKSVLKMARDEYYQGHFRDASLVYEHALTIGADQATINQRLGICYQRLGRISDAVGAYSKAAQAYQVALNAGQGDSRRLKSALDSCNQAIQLLKG